MSIRFNRGGFEANINKDVNIKPVTSEDEKPVEKPAKKTNKGRKKKDV